MFAKFFEFLHSFTHPDALEYNGAAPKATQEFHIPEGLRAGLISADPKVRKSAREGIERLWKPSTKVIHPLAPEERQSHSCKEDDDDYWTLLPGRSSGMSGESKFACRECGETMFRGGWGSSIWLERKH